MPDPVAAHRAATVLCPGMYRDGIHWPPRIRVLH